MNSNTREAGEFQSWDRGGASGGGEPGPWLPASGAPANEPPAPAVECVHCGEPIRWNGSAWTDLDGLNEGCPQRAVDNGVRELPAHEPASANLDPCLCGDRPQSICETGGCSLGAVEALEQSIDDARRVERLINTGIRVGVMQARLASTDLRVFVQGIAALTADGEIECPEDCPCAGGDGTACRGEPFELTNDDAVETLGGLISGARACLRELASAEAKLPGMGGATEGESNGK